MKKTKADHVLDVFQKNNWEITTNQMCLELHRRGVFCIRWAARLHDFKKMGIIDYSTIPEKRGNHKYVLNPNFIKIAEKYLENFREKETARPCVNGQLFNF